MALNRTLLLSLAVVLLVTGGLPAPVRCQEHARPDPEMSAMAAGPGGAVGEEKAYIVGRPLFKVPPSSPCAAKPTLC